jgi:hypothetical protein
MVPGSQVENEAHDVLGGGREVTAVPGRAGPLSIMDGEQRFAASDFMLVYDGFDPDNEGLRETLT